MQKILLLILSDLNLLKEKAVTVNYYKIKARPDLNWSSLAFLFIMAWTSIRRIADAVANDVRSGLRGYHNNMSMSIEQLEQDVVDLRLLIIKEYMLKGILPI